MRRVQNFVIRHWLIIIILIIPLPSLFWLPNEQILMHGLFFPWVEDVSSMFKVAKYYLYAWIPGGFGFATTEPAGFLFYFILALFLKIGVTAHLGQSLLFYFGFVGVLGGMYFLARTLNFSKSASLITGLFYLLSPFIFTGFPVETINFRLIPFHVVTPVLLAFFIKALNGTLFKKDWALFGTICYLATAGYGSLQYFVLHLMILSIYSLFFIFSKYHRQVSLKKGIFRISLLFGIMFLVNYFWLSPLLFNLQDSYNLRAEPGFSADHDGSMVAGTSAKIINALRMIPYSAQIGSSPWMAYYYTLMPTVIIFCFLALGAWSFFSKDTRRYALFPGIWLVIALFLVKGVEKPFAVVGKYIYSFHPYITRLFRNTTYFELLVVPALALLVGLSIGSLIKKTTSKLTMWSSIIMICLVFIFWGWPFVSGVALNQNDESAPSQYNIVPNYYKKTAEFLKNKKENSRINSIPAFTFQDLFVSYKWDSVYIGSQPLGMHSEKSFYRPLYPQLVGKVDPMLNAILHPQDDIISQKLWGLLLKTASVRYITLHHDVAWDPIYRLLPSEVTRHTEDKINGFIAASDIIEKVEEFGKINIYRLRDEFFLPAFYTPQSSIFFKDKSEFSSEINSDSKYKSRVAFYFWEKNSQKNNTANLQSIRYENDNIPILEFKKINQTKYRVRVHGARGKFPLVFSEAYHGGWRVYASRVKKTAFSPQSYQRTSDQKLITNYKILVGNLEEQVSKEDLAEYIKKGWVTELGDGKEKKINHANWDNNNKKSNYVEKHNIDFISKNFQGTIQNNNLPNGKFYETWLSEQVKSYKVESYKDKFKNLFELNKNALELPEKNHLMANGYANSWVINTDEVCENGEFCRRNEDKSYDLELLVEYKPQQMFYVGLFASGATLLVCVALVGTIWCKGKSDKYGKKVYKKEND